METNSSYWRSIEQNGLLAWQTVAIGSDFDGIVNPIKGLWTAENVKDIKPYVLKKAEDYLKNHQSQLLPKNQISAEDIIDHLLFKNADAFLKQNFN